jgi:hypothetical protein
MKNAVKCLTEVAYLSVVTAKANSRKLSVASRKRKVEA